MISLFLYAHSKDTVSFLFIQRFENKKNSSQVGHLRGTMKNFRFWEKWIIVILPQNWNLTLCNFYKSWKLYVSLKNNLELVKEHFGSNTSQGQNIYIHVNWQFSIPNFKFEYIGNSASARMRFVLGIDKAVPLWSFSRKSCCI